MLACGQGPPKEGKTERCGSDITFFEVLGVGLNALLLSAAKDVDRDLEILDRVSGAGLGESTRVDIDLNALEEEFGSGQGAVAGLAHGDILGFGGFCIQLGVAAFGLPDGGFKANFSSIGLIIMSDKDASTIRQAVKAIVDRVVHAFP